MDLTSQSQSIEVERQPDPTSLWVAFRVDACQLAREKIIEYYLPFARMLAAKLYAKRTYLELEFQDYFQFASIGLLEAVDRYDAAYGAKFETFSALRINGAMLNGIKSLSERQEQVGARQRIVADRMKSLRPEPKEPKDPSALFGYLAELAIGIAVGFALEESGMYQSEESGYPDNTYRSVELKQLQQRIRELVESLPNNERRVLTYHYLQHLAFDEVANILGVTKGRVSQIHKDALARLKSSIQRHGGIDLSC